MLTWLPLTGAAGAVTDAVPDGEPGIAGIPLMPDIPGVPPAPEPKVTDGCAAGGEDEHPPSNSTPAANGATKRFRGMGISMPLDRAVGYTGGANTSIAPLTSRTINVGSGFGAIGNWWVITCPLGANDVV
jgi:hypothetical protein